jgi:hypothetical protein
MSSFFDVFLLQAGKFGRDHEFAFFLLHVKGGAPGRPQRRSGGALGPKTGPSCDRRSVMTANGLMLKRLPRKGASLTVAVQGLGLAPTDCGGR